MTRVAAAGALLGAAVTLHGCGQDADDGASRTVQGAWDSHASAFAGKDLDKIMQDYDENSYVWLFNNGGGCSESSAPGEVPPDQTAGLEEFKGKDAIRGMFDGLFKQLAPGEVRKVGPWRKQAVVQTGAGQTANVFQTWRTSGLSSPNAIEHATETYTFGTNAMIAQHNIVVNQPGKACSAGRAKSQPFCGNFNDGSAIKAGICRSWWGDNVNFVPGWGPNRGQGNNLANLEIDDIMRDYSESSVVQLYDTRTEVYIYFDSTVAVRQMHNDMINVIIQADTWGSPSWGIQQILLEVNEATNTVFFVFLCDVYPKATMTYTFENTGDKPKIARMNMHVTTYGGRAAKVSKIHV